MTKYNVVTCMGSWKRMRTLSKTKECEVEKKKK